MHKNQCYKSVIALGYNSCGSGGGQKWSTFVFVGDI